MKLEYKNKKHFKFWQWKSLENIDLEDQKIKISEGNIQSSTRLFFLAGWWFSFHFDLEDGRNKFLRDVGELIQNYTVSYTYLF
jgi:hypothetical protein